MRARRPSYRRINALQARRVADDDMLGAIGGEHRVEFLLGASGEARGGTGWRGSASASGSRPVSPRYHKGPSGSSSTDVGPSSAAAMAAATRRLTASIENFAYSALMPPCTNKISPTLAIAGLRAAHLPSSPDADHAILCSTQPSGVRGEPLVADLRTEARRSVRPPRAACAAAYSRSRRATDRSSTKAAYSPGVV